MVRPPSEKDRRGHDCSTHGHEFLWHGNPVAHPVGYFCIWCGRER